jgi:uncharacterized membrane protein
MEFLKKEKLRFNEIDFVKGLAIITMIISHVFYFKYQMNMSTLDFTSSWYIFLTKFAQIVFITCIGINLSLSYQKNTQRAQINENSKDKKNKQTFDISTQKDNVYVKKQLSRVVIIGIFALTLSFLSYLTHGEKFIKFGILHFASISILAMMWLVGHNLVVMIVLLCMCLLYLFKSNLIEISSNVFHPFLIFVVGIYNPSYNSLDYFPLIPWLAFICFGILLGNYFYKNYSRQFVINDKINKFIDSKNNIISSFILMLGKYSFLIYLLHIPILYFLLSYIKKIAN